MFVEIRNDPRAYHWGSRTAISELLGTPATGEPQAELWLGSHPGSPSMIVAGEGSPVPTLADLPEAAHLPFLLKVLAADAPLSLQAHPSIAQAVAGFARENDLGIALDDPDRNYKDEGHKPEIIVALSEFHALSGFREPAATRALFLSLLSRAGSLADAPAPASFVPLIDRLTGDEPLKAVVGWLLSGAEDVPAVIDGIVRLAALEVDDDPFERERALVSLLSGQYPGDPGIVIALLLNYVVLAPGEALYLPAGNIHAYLRGLGVELMAASDNVLRGGLTPKHVDVDELLSVVDFTPLPDARLPATSVQPGLTAYRPPILDFQLYRVELTESAGDATIALNGPAIVIALSGELDLLGASGPHLVHRGDAAFVTADEGTLAFRGEGVAFVATTGHVATGLLVLADD